MPEVGDSALRFAREIGLVDDDERWNRALVRERKVAFDAPRVQRAPENVGSGLVGRKRANDEANIDVRGERLRSRRAVER